MMANIKYSVNRRINTEIINIISIYCDFYSTVICKWSFSLHM